MARSNWAGAGWDLEGRKVVPKIRIGNVMIELYKNWLSITIGNTTTFVYDGKLRYYVDKNGDLTYVTIIAKQVEDPEGIFFLFEIDKWTNDRKQTWTVAGIGCYGYRDGKWVGVPRELFEQFKRWLRELRQTTLCDENECTTVEVGFRCFHWHICTNIPDPDRLEHWSYNQGTLYLLEKILEKEIHTIDMYNEKLLNYELLKDILEAQTGKEEALQRLKNYFKQVEKLQKEH